MYNERYTLPPSPPCILQAILLVIAGGKTIRHLSSLKIFPNPKQVMCFRDCSMIHNTSTHSGTQLVQEQRFSGIYRSIWKRVTSPVGVTIFFALRTPLGMRGDKKSRSASKVSGCNPNVIASSYRFAPNHQNCHQGSFVFGHFL